MPHTGNRNRTPIGDAAEATAPKPYSNLYDPQANPEVIGRGDNRVPQGTFVPLYNADGSVRTEKPPGLLGFLGPRRTTVVPAGTPGTAATTTRDGQEYVGAIEVTPGEEQPAPEITYVPERRLRKELELASEIEPNYLDMFDTYTYHFRLFMMPEEAYRAGAAMGYAKSEKIIIAESGVPGIGIDEVTIETLGSISKEAGTGTATKFSFVLKQPFGVSLIDMIERSARRLGINNWSKAPFYLELSFRARENDTQAPVNDGTLRDLVWVWPLMFTKTAIAVNTGGSIYNVEAVAMGDLSYTNEIADLDQVETITARTVGEFFIELAERLNKRKNDLGEEETITNTPYLDEYQFFVHDEIANEQIILDGQESKPNRSGVFEVDEDLKTMTFHLNTSIDRIVDSVMSMTKFFQRKVTGAAEPDTSDAPSPDKEEVQFTKMWRVLADAQVRGYDPVRRDYSHRFRYLIVPYEVPTVRTLAKEETDVKPKAIVNTLKRRGVLKKAYNYIFTGLNDQVLDFDVNFNFHWYAALPLNFGLHNSGDSVGLPGSSAVEDSNQSPTETKERFANAVEVKWASANPAPDAEVSNPLGIDFDMGRINRTVANLDQLRGQAPRPDALTEEWIPVVQKLVEDNTDRTNGVPVNESTRLKQEQERARREAAEAATKRPSSGIAPGAFIFAEDLATLEERGTLPRIPVSYRKETHGKQNHINAEGEQNRAKILLSALFEQVRSPAAADLLSIELKVKGDPYWLEPGPVGKRQRPLTSLERELLKRGVPIDQAGNVRRFSDNTPENNTEAPNFSTVSTITDQTFFVFRMHTPVDFDAETGIMTPPSSNNILNGLYAVAQTKHEFANGQFTQTLKSIRMLDLDLNAELIEGLFRGEGFASTSEEIVSDAKTITRQREGDEATARKQENEPQDAKVSAGPVPDVSALDEITTESYPFSLSP